jgi:uncharacterized membrane protein HdeD (DUF308 family)
MTFSNNPQPYPEETRDLKTAIESLRPRWVWIVGLGTLIASLGVAALILVVSATIASVYTIAIFMILAGAAEIATGLSAKTWGRFLLWILAGLAYIVVAAFALAQPLVAAAFFTLVLGAGMLATGGSAFTSDCISELRCAVSFCLRADLRPWSAC